MTRTSFGAFFCDLNNPTPLGAYSQKSVSFIVINYLSHFKIRQPRNKRFCLKITQNSILSS